METGDLIEAVRARRVVELHYRGRGARVVHPHAVYRTASGSLPGWRDFDLMKFTDVRVLDVGFEPADDFNRAAERYGRGLLASV